MNTRLVLLSQSDEQSSPYLDVDETGAIVGRDTLSPRVSSRPFKGRTILIVPGTEVVTRWLALDAVPRARVMEAAAVLLKDQTGTSLDGVDIAVGEPEDDGLRPVSVIDRLLLQDFLARAAELGISPETVVPDHLILDPPDEGVITVSLGSLVVVRGQNIAFTAEEDLASMLIGDRPRMAIEYGPEMDRLLATASVRPAINLLQQDFVGYGGRAKWGGYPRIAALAAIVALSPLAIWTAELVRDEAAARGLEGRAEARARVIIGDARSADPIGELRGRVAGLRANDELMRTVAALFEAISRAKGTELESLSYLQEGAIRATVMHATPSDMDALRGVLEQSGVKVDEDATQERGDRKVTTITLNGRS